MLKMKKRFTKHLWALAVIGAYPVFVLGYTWSHVAQAEFPGGRNGPLDAYRHSLASALVSYTLSPIAVEVVTAAMERSGTPANLMDQHNNHLGAWIGSQAKTFSDIEPLVHSYVVNGQINATAPKQITWMAPEQWTDGWLW